MGAAGWGSKCHVDFRFSISVDFRFSILDFGGCRLGAWTPYGLSILDLAAGWRSAGQGGGAVRIYVHTYVHRYHTGTGAERTRSGEG